MTEETPQPAESPSAPPEQTPTEQPRDDAGKWRPATLPEGETWEQVELPEAVKGRFNRLYGQVKRSQATNDQLVRDNLALAERLAKLEGDVHSKKTDDTLSSLRQQKAEALANQDYVRVAEIDDALLEFRLQAVIPKPAKQEAYDPPPQQKTLDPATERQVIEWRDEKGPDGQLLRPWIRHGHPLYEKAFRIAEAINVDPEVDPDDVPEKMRRIDELMRVARPVAQRPVEAPKPAPRPISFLSAETPPRTETPQPHVTAEQRYIAKKMYPGLPAEQAVERYKQAVMKHGK